MTSASSAGAGPLPATRRYAARMATFLAIFTGAATDEERERLTDEQSAVFVEQWGAWAGSLGPALVDPGAPLFTKVRLTAEGAAPFEDAKTAYAVVEAPSHDAAVGLFTTHPHLALHPGNAIEVIECPAPPA